MEDDRKKAEVVQLPLRLAWAITIHKSQGMSLDAAEIDLSKSFTPGMGYVALSRVRSLDGVYLSGINNMALQLHPDIYEFDRQLQQSSAALAANTPDAPEVELINEVTPVAASYDELLFQKLKAWRLERAKHDRVAPFMIAHNTTLEELATHPPQTPQQLLGVKGFGPNKQTAYGAEILEVIHNHQLTKQESEGEPDPNALLAMPRAAIDEINSKILQLLKERQDVVETVAVIKTAHGIGIYQPGREQTMLDRIAQQAQELGIDKAEALAIFKLLHEQSIQRQRSAAKNLTKPQ